MKNPFFPRAPFARLLAIVSVAALFVGGTLLSSQANTVPAQLLQSDIEACREHVNSEYRQLGLTIKDAYTTAFMAEKQTALAEIQAAIPSFIERMRAGESKEKIIAEVKEAYITRLKAVLPPFKEIFLQKKEELIQAWHDCAIDTTITFHLEDITFDEFDFRTDTLGNNDNTTGTECPVPACVAPAEGCTYIQDGTLNANGCPLNPCGVLTCEGNDRDEDPTPTTCGSSEFLCGNICCSTTQACEQDNQGNGSCYDSNPTPTCGSSEFLCGNTCCSNTQACEQDSQGNGSCYDPTPPPPPPLTCGTGETACGTICCGSSQSCSNGTCQEVDQCVATNRACNQHADCCGENICDERQKKCKRPKDNGTTCESSSECAGDSTCQPDGTGNPNYYGRCAYNQGSLCYPSDTCAGDNECIDSICKPTGAAEGESCSASVTCKEGGGLQCKNGVCRSIVSTTPPQFGGKPAEPPACRSIDDNTDQYRQNKIFGKDRDNNFADVAYLGGTGVMDPATNMAYLFEGSQIECATSGASCEFSKRIFKVEPGEMYGSGLQYMPMKQIAELPFAWHGIQTAWDQVNSRAYLFGGIRPTNDFSTQNLNYIKDIYTFTPNGAVQKIASLPLVSNGNTANNVVVGAFNPNNQKLYLIETGRYNTLNSSAGNTLGDTTGRNDNYTRMWVYNVSSRQFETVNPPFIGDFWGKVSITYDPLKDKLYVFNTKNNGGTVYEVDPDNYQFTQVANVYSLVHDAIFDLKTKQLMVLSGNNRNRSIQAFDTNVYRFMPTNYNGTLLEQVQILPFNSPDVDYTSLLMPLNRAERKTGTHSNGTRYTYNGHAENTMEFVSILNCAGVSCHSQATQAPVIRFYHNDGGGLNTTIAPNRAVQIEDTYFALFANSNNNSMRRVTMYSTENGAHGVFTSFPEESKNAVVADVEGTKTLFATNVHNTKLYSVTVSRNRSNPSDSTQMHFGNMRTVATLNGIATDAVAQYDAARKNIVFFSNESGIHSYNIESNTLKQHQTTLLENGTIADIKVAYLPTNSNGINAFILTDGAVNNNGTSLASTTSDTLNASLMERPEVDPNPSNTKYHFVHYTSGTDSYYIHSNATFNAPWSTRFQKINQVVAYGRDALFIGNNEIYQMNVGLRTFAKVYDSQEAGFTLNDLVTVQNSGAINPDLLYSFAPVRSNAGVKTPYIIHLNSCQ